MELENRAPSSILTISEVAVQLRLSTNTIRKFLHEGRLKGVRSGAYGGKWRISQKAIDDFLVSDPGPAQISGT
jgi:DNA binding domain, excisionase family